MVAVVAVAVLLAVPAGDGLVLRHSRAAPFTVRVPTTWVYRDRSYPSDHSTETWRDPSRASSRLDVEVSACAGCAQPPSCVLHGTGCGPDPTQLVPENASSRRRIDRWRMSWTLGASRGLVVVLHDASGVTGFAVAVVTLPTSRARLAEAILASFRISGR